MKNFLIVLFIILSIGGLFANVRLPKILASHAVLQRSAPINIWGWADKGEKVTVTMNHQKQSVITDNTGKWLIKLNAMPAGGPYDLIVKGKNTIVLNDILVGEVWLCSGQSNMEFTLKSSQNAAKEIPIANYPVIRHFKIKDKISAIPAEDIEAGEWNVCSPGTVSEFTAIGYYFAKFINTELNVPVGIINASKGGTYIEAWISQAALCKLPDYKQVPALSNEQLEKWFANVEDLYSYYAKQLSIASLDNFKTDDSQWHLPKYDDSKWLPVPFPGDFDKTILPCFDGTVWFRTVVDIDEKAANECLTLRLGEMKDDYEVYINGERINSIINTDSLRHYEIDTKKLIPGKNVLAIKIIDNWETGGFVSSADQYFIEGKNGFKILFAEQPWKMNISSVIRVWIRSPNVEPNLLFNGMIYPIIPYTIKGTLWYQGENNEDYAFQYRKLLPLLIADWRDQFKQGAFPFYFVQLPNFKKFNQNSQHGGSNWAEIRESQSKTLTVPNTGMAVAIDLGDSTNIHPKNKEDVGKRFSFIALNNLYNNPTEYSGPDVDHVTYNNGKIIVIFKKSGSCLVVNDRYGYLKGFEIAGEDQHFYSTKAIVDGNNIILQNDKVPEPVAVRYAWSNNPDGNLYNGSGLPASPFRTDTWNLSTEGNKFDSWIGNRYQLEYKKPETHF